MFRWELEDLARFTVAEVLAETILKHYLSITIPWQAISAVLALAALTLIVIETAAWCGRLSRGSAACPG